MQNRLDSLKSNFNLLKAVGFALLTVFSFTAMAIAGRYAVIDFDSFEIMLFRSLFGLIIVSTFLTFRSKWQDVEISNLRVHVFRNMLHFAGQNFWFFSITLVSLAEVVAIEFTSPLWILLISFFFIKKEINFARISSCLLGFFGVLILLRPTLTEMNLGYLTASLASIFLALTIVTTKRLTQISNTVSILFFMMLTQTIFGLAVVGIDFPFKSVELISWISMSVIGLSGILAHLCLTRALSLAPSTVIAPIEFLRLPFVAVAAFYFFSEIVDIFMVVGILEEVGREKYSEIGNILIAKTNDFVRSEIKKIPNGTFKSIVTTSGVEAPLEIKCEVKIRNESIVVDYSGTSSSQAVGINVPLCYAYAHTVYPLKCLIAPNLPNNYGLIQPFVVNAPEGCILNPIFPAPVNARHLTGQFLSSAIFKAMAACVPSRVISESGVPRPQIVFSGTNKIGEKFVEHIFLSSGLGAGDGFHGADVLCFPTNTSNTPVEIFELQTSLKVLRKSIRLESGGRGKFWGGCGQCFAVQNIGKTNVQVSLLADLSHRGATGLFGGGDGLAAKFVLNGKTIPDKFNFDLKENDILEIMSAGGGGFGKR